MSKHPESIQGYNSPRELAIEISNLRYDVLAEVVKELSAKLELDAEQDRKRNRKKLSSRLNNASIQLQDVYDEIVSAWNICKFYEEN